MPLSGAAKAKYQREYMRRRRAGQKQPTHLVPLPASWQIVVITKDGKRYGNGVRLKTEGEADLYRMLHVVGDFWDAYRLDKSLKEPQRVFVATEAIPTNDPPNMGLLRDKRGKLTNRLLFPDGTCGELGWHEIK
jgi:hypothetical protein